MPTYYSWELHLRIGTWRGWLREGSLGGGEWIVQINSDDNVHSELESSLSTGDVRESKNLIQLDVCFDWWRNEIVRRPIWWHQGSFWRLLGKRSSGWFPSSLVCFLQWSSVLSLSLISHASNKYDGLISYSWITEMEGLKISENDVVELWSSNEWLREFWVLSCPVPPKCRVTPTNIGVQSTILSLDRAPGDAEPKTIRPTRTQDDR